MTNVNADSANEKGVPTFDFRDAYHAVERSAGDALDLQKILSDQLADCGADMSKYATLSQVVEDRINRTLDELQAVWSVGLNMEKKLTKEQNNE